MSILLPMLTGPYVEFDFTRMAFDARVSFSRSSDGTYFDAAGVMQTAASNVPRKEHDPATGAVRGLLVEEQRTNLLLRSHDFSSADWTKLAAGAGVAPVVVGNAATAPDGTATASKVTLNAPASGDISSLTRAVTSIPAGTQHVGSEWVKAFNPANVGKKILARHVAGFSYTEVTLTSGWQRVSRPETSSGAGTKNYDAAVLRPQLGGSAGTVELYLWGTQLEAGSYPTSYIPTTTATVTRSADVATFTIPPRVVRLVTIYDDGTTSQQAVTPGASYTIPTGQKPILRIRGYYA